MNSKTLAVILSMAAVILTTIALGICSIWTYSDTMWTVVFILCGTSILMLGMSLILFYKIEERVINFKPRFSYRKLLVILPVIVLLTACGTTKVCNHRNGKTKYVYKTKFMAEHIDKKKIW